MAKNFGKASWERERKAEEGREKKERGGEEAREEGLNDSCTKAGELGGDF